MIDRPVLRYFGGKFVLAEWILEFFPDHALYVEPFAGAASVLMRKAPSEAECLNDLSDRIVNVFRVLRDPTTAAELRRRIEFTPYSRTEFSSAYSDPPEDNIDAALKTVILSFMSHGALGLTGARTGFRCKHSDTRGLPVAEWITWTEAIPKFTERLRSVAIENRDALEVIARMDSPDTLFYVDPPYPHSTRGTKDGYTYELTDDQHRALADVLHGAKGMVVLSGYACDLYDVELYPQWERHLYQTYAADARSRIEVVWLNPACASRQKQQRLGY